MVFDVSKPKNPEAPYLIPQAISIPFADDAGEFVASIRRVMEKHKKTSFLSFLILNKNGEQYEKIERLIEEAELRNVFYLKEGLMGYKEFLKQQALMRQPKDHSKKTLEKCQMECFCPCYKKLGSTQWQHNLLIFKTLIVLNSAKYG